MGDLWRSEEMQLVQLIIPTDAAHSTVAELGELGLMQFKDLNPDQEAFARTYASQVRRCNEMSRRLRFFHEQVTGAEIPMASATTDIGADLDELESKLEELEKELTVINENSERLKKSEAELVELQLVLEKAGSFFDEARASAQGTTYDNSTASLDAPLLDDVPEALKSTRLGFTAGTIDVENLIAFERLLFRATRGNMYLRQSDVGTVTDPNTNKDKQKAVFVVFYAGERAHLKITKTCEAFSANRYPFPEESARQRQMHSDVSARLLELSTTIAAGSRRRDSVLEHLALSLQSWITVVRREKAVYHTMNKLSFDVTQQALVAEAWAPLDARVAIQTSLQSATVASNASVGTVFQPLATAATPPTYFKTTKFTETFHTIVEAYGVARYREINPTTFTLVTFPFFFAVMFGDVGHAAMMLAFSAFLLIRERSLLKQKLSDIEDMIFGGRYIIFMMSLFSIFTGFMYNEFFSMPMAHAGPTRYACFEADPATNSTEPVFQDFRECALRENSTVFTTGLEFNDDRFDTPYPFGLDPIWHGTRTELTFFNSLKMKMSIVMGVVHMTLGIVMSLFNHLFFHDRLGLIFEFFPQMVFLWGLFGYLGFLIVYKWVAADQLEARSVECNAPCIAAFDMCTDACAEADAACNAACAQAKTQCDAAAACPVGAPSLFSVMIDMVLSPGSVGVNELYDGQALVQVVLLLLAFVSVPLMLLPKPLILRSRHKKLTESQGYATVGAQDARDAEASGGGGSLEPSGNNAHGHGEAFDFGEVFVHQAIHTIEFVLGAVSNTASYLRLWALSLAHAQLSAVIYDKILMMTIRSGSIPILIAGAFMWLMSTLAVLMGMESLSAFLHALRLHWVEYQNKFYHGDGILFAPFAFKDVDNDETFLAGTSKE